MSAFHKIVEVAIEPLPVRINDPIYFQVYKPTVANTQLIVRDLIRKVHDEVMAKW